MSTDIVISFDTTGSMSPCIAEVRRRVTETLNTLFDRIPDLRVGIVSHGDYCDRGNRLDYINLTDNKDSLVHFVNKTPNTNGGDGDEFYEYVLHFVQTLDWQADTKIFMLIGDALPHRIGYTFDGETYNYDWREEATLLSNKGVAIYSIEALGNHNSKLFYEPLARIGNGRKLDLTQFTDAVETILAVCYHNTDNFIVYKQELESGLRMNRGLAETFKRLGAEVTLAGVDKSGLVPVDPFRFQLLNVDYNVSIKDFVESTGARFHPGSGFYQFTKSELIQEHKEVVLRNKLTGDMFTGSEAREYIGLPYGVRGVVKPGLFSEYEVYVQSTSYNRVLKRNTKFLYEVA